MNHSTDEGDSTVGESRLEQLIRLLREEGIDELRRSVEAAGTPREAAAVYAEIAYKAYSEQRDVVAMTAVSHAAIDYCLQVASRRAREDAELANWLRSTAKTIAFNLSANCWPGWQEEGISLTEEDQRVGYQAARLNLQLAQELDKPADKQAAAHWLLAAHLLALGNTEEALSHFEQAEAFAKSAQDPAAAAMNRGYAAIARKIQGTAAEEAAQAYQSSVAELQQLDHPDAGFYAEQLVSVHRYFLRSSR